MTRPSDNHSPGNCNVASFNRGITHTILIIHVYTASSPKQGLLSRNQFLELIFHPNLEYLRTASKTPVLDYIVSAYSRHICGL